MKLKFSFSAIMLFVLLSFCACSDSKAVRDGFFRGMYEGANQAQQMEHPEEPSTPEKEPLPTYDQYKRERQEIVTDQEKDASQPIK